MPLGKFGTKDFGHKTKGDIAGFCFFALATALSFASLREHNTIFAWLATLHNGLLAYLFLVRRQPTKSDQIGLWLGLIAALLPILSYPDHIPTILLVVGILAYGLMIWSVLVLWKSFGVAPADRGLVTKAPYSLVRHPMYLGELVFRLAIVLSSWNITGLVMFLALTLIQILRIRREERIITGYEEYKENIRWRLIPGVW